MSAPVKDPWVLLGVDRSADDRTIKRAYRKLALKYHPDRNPNDAEAAALFQEIARAFEAVGTEEARAAWIAENEGYGNDSLFEPLDNNQPFADPFQAPGAGLRTDAPVPAEHRLTIPFAQAYSGTQVHLDLDLEEACGACGGSGSAAGYRPLTCQVCHGRGTHSAGRVTSPCSACSGKGFIVEKPCGKCAGGLVRHRRQIALDVPAGVPDGHVIRVPAARGRTAASEVLVHIGVEPSAVFKRTLRDPADLLIDVPITYAEACLGRSVKIPTPEKPIALRVQPGSPSGKALRIPGQGMPRMGNPSERGHLYARLQVIIPTQLNAQQQRLVTQLSHYDDPEELRVHLFNGGRPTS